MNLSPHASLASEPVAAGPPLDWRRLRRIIVLRALYLGDMLCAVPALRAMRRAAPAARITLAGLPWACEFAARFRKYIDEFIEFPGFPGLSEQPCAADALSAFLTAVQQRKFDLAVQLHGSGITSNVAVALFGAARTTGYYAPGGYFPDPSMFLPYRAEGPEIRRNLLLVTATGAAPQGEHLELPLYREDWNRLEQLLAGTPARTEPYACLHAGAKWESRRWPAEKFAAVGQALAADGLHLVLTGSQSEEALVGRLSGLLGAPHTNLCGRTDLGTLGALVRRASLVVTNDTGMSHVAAATRTPSVVVVLGSDADRWRPLDVRRHRMVLAECPCRPSAAPRCPYGTPCADRVSPLTVYAAAQGLLAEMVNRRTAPRPPALPSRRSAGGRVCVG